MIGQTIAHYEILSLLGKGGMGEVYRARDTSLDREVALKVLPLALQEDPERRARIEREARTVAGLNRIGALGTLDLLGEEIHDAPASRAIAASPSTGRAPARTRRGS